MHIDDLILALTRINSGATFITENKLVTSEWIYIRKYGQSYRITHVDKASEKSVLIKTAPLKEVIETLFKNCR